MALLRSLPSSAALPLAGGITLRVEFPFFGTSMAEARVGEQVTATYVDHVL